MKHRQILTFIIVIAVVVALSAWALWPKPIAVETATITRGEFIYTVDELAKTRIRDHYVISAPLAGEMDRVMLLEGDDVTAGTTIATLHPALPTLLDARTESELRGRLEAAKASKTEAEARVARAKIALAQSNIDLQRNRRMAEAKLIPQATLDTNILTVALNEKELEAGQAAAHVAQHDIDVARAALTQALETRTDRRQGAWKVESPTAGRVLKIYQKSSGTVTLGAPLIEVGDMSNMEVVIQLLTSEAPQVSTGDEVVLENWGGARPLRGRVRRIEPMGFTKFSALGVEEQRVNVLVDIASPRNEWENLAEAYRLDAKIVVYHQPNALLVPTGALSRVGNDWCVYVVGDNGKAQLRIAKIGLRNERTAEILSGLRTGEQVILYPSDAVRNDSRVATE